MGLMETVKTKDRRPQIGDSGNGSEDAIYLFANGELVQDGRQPRAFVTSLRVRKRIMGSLGNGVKPQFI